MRFYSQSGSRVLTNDILIIGESFLESFERELVDVSALPNSTSRHWCAQVAASFLDHFHLRRPQRVAVLQNVVTKRQPHCAHHTQNSVKLTFGNPALKKRKISSQSHTYRNRVSVEQPGLQLETRRPCVTVSVRATLMSFPQISVLGLYVPFHSFRNDSITENVDFASARTIFHTELGFNQTITHCFDVVEQCGVFGHGHFDDFGDSMSNPAGMQSFEELSIGQSENWWMICAENVLVA